MFRDRTTAKQRIVRECMSTRRYEKCDAHCRHSDEEHKRYMLIMDIIVQKVIELSDEEIITFCLHVFKNCNTGFNSYTFNRLIGLPFGIKDDWNLKTYVIHMMSDVLDQLERDPIPELEALDGKDREMFLEMMKIERNAMTGAFYDTIYKSRGTNSVIGNESWYSKRYIDSFKGPGSEFVLPNPANKIRYKKRIDKNGHLVVGVIDRNDTIKKIVRDYDLNLPQHTVSNIREKNHIEIKMFSWFTRTV